MNSYKDKFKLTTRWADIPNYEDGYRLLCNQEDCSLSCANLREGRLSVTSVHGDARHSYVLSKKDMVFMTSMFLSSLTKEELDTFIKIFNKISPDYLLTQENFS